MWRRNPPYEKIHKGFSLVPGHLPLFQSFLFTSSPWPSCSDPLPLQLLLTLRWASLESLPPISCTNKTREEKKASACCNQARKLHREQKQHKGRRANAAIVQDKRCWRSAPPGADGGWPHHGPLCSFLDWNRVGCRIFFRSLGRGSWATFLRPPFPGEGGHFHWGLRTPEGGAKSKKKKPGGWVYSCT